MAEQCIALCDYDAGTDEELSFRAGDVLTVEHKSSDGFWRCLNQHGIEGQVPSCMVTSNCTPQLYVTNKAVALFNYTPKDAKEMPFHQFDVLTITGPHTSPGWWLATNDSVPEDRTPKLVPVNFVTFNLVVTAYGFTARKDFELSISKGDVIRVIRRWNDGWWEGYVGNRRGLFPSNYTVPNVCTFVDPVCRLFCNKCKDTILPPATECMNCARNEEIVSTMSRSLSAWCEDAKAARNSFDLRDHSPTSDSASMNDDDVVVADMNLFEHIDVDPVKGRAALLRFEDVRDGKSIRTGITPQAGRYVK